MKSIPHYRKPIYGPFPVYLLLLLPLVFGGFLSIWILRALAPDLQFEQGILCVCGLMLLIELLFLRLFRAVLYHLSAEEKELTAQAEAPVWQQPIPASDRQKLRFGFWRIAAKHGVYAEVPVHRVLTFRQGRNARECFAVCYLPDGKYVFPIDSYFSHTKQIHLIRYCNRYRAVPYEDSE